MKVASITLVGTILLHKGKAKDLVPCVVVRLSYYSMHLNLSYI